jgi:hypothetical protein
MNLQSQINKISSSSEPESQFDNQSNLFYFCVQEQIDEISSTTNDPLDNSEGSSMRDRDLFLFDDETLDFIEIYTTTYYQNEDEEILCETCLIDQNLERFLGDIWIRGGKLYQKKELIKTDPVAGNQICFECNNIITHD